MKDDINRVSPNKAQNAARSSSRCQSSPMSTPVELCRKTWKTASLQLVLEQRESRWYLSPHELKATTCHWPQPQLLSVWPHSKLSDFFFSLFQIFTPLLSFDFLSFFQTLLLPILTLILTPLAVSCLCHQVLRQFQMLTLASATPRTDDA